MQVILKSEQQQQQKNQWWHRHKNNELSLCRDSKLGIPILQSLDEVLRHTGLALVQGLFKVMKAYWTNLFNRIYQTTYKNIMATKGGYYL